MFEQNPKNIKKQCIEIMIALTKDTFDGINNVKIYKTYIDKYHLTMSTSIDKSGGKQKDVAKVVIVGIEQSTANKLTTLNFKPLQITKNKIRISAGYDNELTTIFEGNITKANYIKTDPDNQIEIEAQAGYYNQIQLNDHVNIKGKVKAQKVFNDLAVKSGLTLKNNGVDKELLNPILTGGATTQIDNLAEQLNIEAKIDNEYLIISPKNKPYSKQVALVKWDTGLINSPKIDEKGIVFNCKYIRDLVFGGIVKVESIEPKANGFWKIYNLKYDLTNNSDKFDIEVKATYYSQ